VREGIESARHTRRVVISNSVPVVITAEDEHDADSSGSVETIPESELEIVAIELPDLVLVIHVTPTQLRRRG